MEAFPHDDDSFDYIYKSKISLKQSCYRVTQGWVNRIFSSGKRVQVLRYVKGIYSPLDPTIGVEFATKTLQLSNNVKIKSQIWDTCKDLGPIAGSERYRAITKGHYRKAVGALLVYDVSNYESFQNLQYWLEQLQQNSDPNVVICLIGRDMLELGNKCDLMFQNPHARMVTREEAKQLAEQNNLIFIDECSALADINIKESVEALVQRIYEVQSDLVSRGIKKEDTLKITIEEAKYNQSKSGCCY